MTNKQATHHSKDSFGIHIAAVNTLQKHRALLKERHIGQSMSRKGNYWDNAVAESFFHSLETQCVLHERYQIREQAQASILIILKCFITENAGIVLIIKCRLLTSNLFEM